MMNDTGFTNIINMLNVCININNLYALRGKLTVKLLIFPFWAMK